jgi:hypothetical protein
MCPTAIPPSFVRKTVREQAVAPVVQAFLGFDVVVEEMANG